MELDELKTTWAAFDQRLKRLEVASVRRGHDCVRRELRPLVVGQAIQVLVGAGFAVAGGSFWVDHAGAIGLLVAGLLLHVYGIAAIVAAARNLYLANRVRADAPVLELQQRIVTLRAWRIREGRWFGIVGCFMWVPMVIWAFGMGGIDVVATQPAYVACNLLVALICLGIFLFVLRHDRSPEGSAVRRARERLDEMARFRDA